MAKAPATIGDNGGPIMGDARDQLKDFFTRLESLADEAAAIREAVKDLGAEIKAAGFKPALVKKLVALRGKDRVKLLAENETRDLYAVALGVDDLV